MQLIQHHNKRQTNGSSAQNSFTRLQRRTDVRSGGDGRGLSRNSCPGAAASRCIERTRRQAGGLRCRSIFTASSRASPRRNHNLRPTQMKMQLVDGPFKMLDGTWNFKALRADACKVDFDLHYEFSSMDARAADRPGVRHDRQQHGRFLLQARREGVWLKLSALQVAGRATPRRDTEFLRALRVAPGTTDRRGHRAQRRAAGASRASTWRRQPVGIFGKKKTLDTVLRERDRIEIYRPLMADPKESRRKRAARKRRDAADSVMQLHAAQLARRPAGRSTRWLRCARCASSSNAALAGLSRPCRCARPIRRRAPCWLRARARSFPRCGVGLRALRRLSCRASACSACRACCSRRLRSASVVAVGHRFGAPGRRGSCGGGIGLRRPSGRAAARRLQDALQRHRRRRRAVGILLACLWRRSTTNCAWASAQHSMRAAAGSTRGPLRSWHS